MGYQALLFCPDEKTARVVTQVFTELDFIVDPVNEPFAAVKKLMAQRFDAIVVDCDHEQNATLLFKSARNSSTNQNSLAFALVEGQAGVAKAYRIGANLVLTKPINMEQAKGTLRVARGLLRKSSDTLASTTAPAAASAAPAKPAAAASSPKPSTHVTESIPQASNKYEAPEFEPTLPALTATAQEKPPAATPTPEAASKIPDKILTSSGQHPDFTSGVAKPEISPVGTGKRLAPATGITQGAAAAPAPARETTPLERKAPVVETREVRSPHTHPAETSAAPTFSALGSSESSEGGGGTKKILAIAAAILVVAVLGYFGWTKFGKTSASQTSTTAVQPLSSQPASVLPSAPPSSSPGAPEAANSAARPSTHEAAPQTAKPSSLANVTSATKNVLTPEPAVNKPEPPPIRVKSEPVQSKVQKPVVEESAPQMPNPLGVASSNDQSLSKLVTAAPAAMPTANLGTLKISQGVSQGLVIKRVQPVYPRTALTMHVQGAVQLEATISKEGTISNIKIIKGDAVLGRAAMDAVRQWRYKPYYLDGQPVEIETQITVNFKLPD